MAYKTISQTGSDNTSPAATSYVELETSGGLSEHATLANILTLFRTTYDALYQAYSATLDTWATKTAPSGTVVGHTDTQTLTNKTYDLGENTIILDAALSADGKYSGITEAGTAGAALVFGDLCYLQTSDSRWEKVDANAAATSSNKLGICVLAAAGDASATTMLLYGKIRADSVFPTLTIGAPVFASTTAGAIQTTAPSGAADIIRIIGYGNTADELHFCPSNDYFEHV